MPQAMNRPSSEQGSLPLALLAVIVVAGIVSVLLARVVAGERATRFDRDFSDALQTADVGISRGLFALNEDIIPTGTTTWPASQPTPTTVGDTDYEWSMTKIGAREWEITSRSTTPSGVSRKVVATAEDQPLFFPGAFGDRFVGLNGTSTHLDSYNSDPACSSACWGNNDAFGNTYGTGNATIGTNLQLDLTGQANMAPGSGYLFDWDANPGTGAPAPFGKRLVDGQLKDSCKGNQRCTTEYVSAVGKRHEGMSEARINFIYEKFEAGEICTDTSDPIRWKGTWSLGVNQGDAPVELRSYATTAVSDPGVRNPSDPAFTNFYCAENLDINSNVILDELVTPENPVVIFVRNRLKVVHPNLSIACHGPGSVAQSNCDADTYPGTASARVVRPQAARLQIYVAGLGPDNVNMKNGEFAGVVFAPKSSCDNAGGAHFFGAMVCKVVSHVGFWNFHYDDALGTYGTGFYSVARWEERAP